MAAGPSAAVGVAFGVELRRFRLGSSEVRGRVGPILVPAALADVIEGVFGLDDRPQASAHFRVYDGPLEDLPGRAWPATAAVAGSFSPPEIARLYDFLTDADGSGQAIALIELGGGYRSGDLAAWFSGLGISQPEVRAVLVDGGRNTPGAADRRRRRGDARHRGRRVGRSRSPDRRLLRPEHGSRLPRRDHPGDP